MIFFHFSLSSLGLGFFLRCVSSNIIFSLSGSNLKKGLVFFFLSFFGLFFFFLRWERGYHRFFFPFVERISIIYELVRGGRAGHVLMA